MTVASPAYRAGPYAGDGVSTTFPIDFYFLEDSHIAVFRRGLDGVDRRLTEGADYSIAGAGDEAGGSATLNAPLLGGETLAVIRDVPLTQEVDYPEGGRFPARTHERALDKITMTLQQLREAVGRAVLLTPGSAAVDVVIPDPAAGLPLGWDPAGSGNLVNLQALGGWKGEWATGTAYDAGDIMKDEVTGNLYVALIAHSSAATIAADLTTGKLLLAIDVEAVTNAQTAAEAAETHAAGSESAASSSAADAAASAGAAAASEAAVASSAALASGAATASAASETAAAASETAAGAAQGAAETARDQARDWAETPEDVAVMAGQFSARHHAAKAAASASAAAADAANLTFASQGEAEAGTDNARSMTPLRTAQAIAAQEAFRPADRTKLDGVETGATADLTGTEIVAAIDAQLGQTGWQSGAGGRAIASQVEAEAGADNVKGMTPLRVKQAIDALAPTGGGGGGASAWGDLTGSLSDQTDLQAALDGKTATGHGHVVADVTGLQPALDGKRDASADVVAGEIAAGAVDSFSVFASSLVATQTDAEVGALLDKIMTPRRVKEAVLEFAPQTVFVGMTQIRVVTSIPGAEAPGVLYVVAP